jgi:hypothetical protein
MLHEYYVIYSLRYCPRFHITAVDLGTRRYGDTTVHIYVIIKCTVHWTVHLLCTFSLSLSLPRVRMKGTVMF